MKTRYVISYLGVILEILGMALVIPIILSAFFGEAAYYAFLIAAVASFVTGTILDKKFPKGEIDFGSAMALASLSFVVVGFFGAVPFLPYLSPIDAVFESFSGFTTTGLTTVLPENLPGSLLIWRSMTQWLGGLGVLFVFLLMLPSLGISSSYLYMAEGEENTKDVYRRVKRVSMIYLSYTVLGVLLFALAGMPIFDAAAHSMSAVSTGGFSTRNNSLASFHSPLVSIVACLLMILGATSFIIHDKMWKLNFLCYLKNPEARLFWALVVIFSLLLLLTGSSIYSSVFHVISALTTTGFTVSELNSGAMAFLLSILMLAGGFVGSTAGGLKLLRVFVVGKGLYWFGKKFLLPREAILPFRAGQAFLKASSMLKIFIFVFTYLLLLGITTIAISLLGYPPMVSFFQAAAAQGNSAMSLIPIASLPAAAKILLIFNMLLGRLEIFPFIAMLIFLLRIRRY